MSWRTMNPRDRAAIVRGGLVLLPFLLYVWGVRPYVAALSDARDTLATERGTLARERDAVAAAQHDPERQRLADSAMRAMAPRLFEGKDDVMASAELASYLGDAARDARVLLQEANTRPAPPTADGLRTLRVDIRAESDLLGTLLFLRGLEQGTKLVRVDRIDISRVSRLDQKDGEVLAIVATVSGFALPATAAAPTNVPVTTAVARASTGATP